MRAPPKATLQDREHAGRGQQHVHEAQQHQSSAVFMPGAVHVVLDDHLHPELRVPGRRSARAGSAAAPSSSGPSRRPRWRGRARAATAARPRTRSTAAPARSRSAAAATSGARPLGGAEPEHLAQRLRRLMARAPAVPEAVADEQHEQRCSRRPPARRSSATGALQSAARVPHQVTDAGDQVIAERDEQRRVDQLHAAAVHSSSLRARVRCARHPRPP